ncbi:putative ribonuclease H-like domain-containing protein [Tanacetum coccineum]
MAFVSTPGSTNEDTAHIPVSTASTPISAASTNDSAARLSDATIYVFLANQPYRSQIFHEDLEQIHDDDLEEMDLKWQLALLSMRVKKFYQRTGKKITINRGDTIGLDKTKLECFNCHKLGHFARKCRIPRGQDGRAKSYDQGSRNQEITRRTVKSFETLKAQNDKLRIDCNKTEFDLANYKRALTSVEEQLAFYKQNEVIFTNKIAILKRDATFNEAEIITLKTIIEKLKKEKEDNLLKINNYENATKSLDKVIGSQLIDNNNKGLGYNAISPPPTGLFVPPSIDLSHSGIEKFKEPEFVGYGVKVDKIVSKISPIETKKTPDAPIIEDWVSDCEKDEIVSMVSSKRASFICRSLNHQIKDYDYHDKKMGQKPVLNKGKKGTGDRESKLVWNDAMRTNHQNFSNNRRNFSPKAVLTKSGKVPISTARQSSPRAAVPISTAKPVDTAAPKSLVNVAKYRTNVFQKRHSPTKRPVHQETTLKNRNLKKSSSKGGKISGKGTIRADYLDFEDVYFVKELKFNLFSVSHMCDKKNSVLFIETECLIFSPNFKLPDENQVMLKIPRKDNMYSFDLKNIVPSKGLTCLIAKATNDESKLWHRRLGHINFKTLNKLVKGNLVRGLPSKIFENDHTCVACQKGKQHKASLITDDYSRFSWIFFLAKKDETSGILRIFITGIENQLNHRVKIIRSDNGTEFKNQNLNQFSNSKGIKREYNNARTPQQNGVAERKNRTLIEAARTILADSLLPTPFWAKAVNIACYVHNRVLVTKPHNKTPYELLIGRPTIISFMRPFGCPVTILNTLDHLGKFDGKADEGVLVGYSISSKAFRVYNHRTRKVEENLHVNFLENQPNIAGIGPKWMFDIDSLTNTMNYHPVSVGNRANVIADVSSPNDDDTSKKVEQEPANVEDYILKDVVNNMLNQEKMATKHSDDARSQFKEECDAQLFKGMRTRTSSANSFNTVRTPLNTASALRTSYPAGTSSEPQLMPIDGSFSIDINDYPDDPLMPELEDTAKIYSTGIFGKHLRHPCIAITNSLIKVLESECFHHHSSEFSKVMLSDVSSLQYESSSQFWRTYSLQKRTSHPAQFVEDQSPKAVLTKSGKVPISTARQSSPRAAILISTAKPIITVAPKSLVNVAKYRTNVFQKRHSPTRRPIHQETALKNKNLKTNYVNTVKTKRVTSDVEKKGVNVVKPSACWVWRPKIKGIDHVSKVALKDTGIFDSGYSRHMTGNKSFLTNCQEYDRGFVTFAGSSKGGIETNSDAGQAKKEKVPDQEYILLPLLHTSSYGPSTSKEDVSSPNDDDAGKKVEQEPANVEDHTLKDAVNNMLNQEKMDTKHSDDGRS